MQRVGTPADTIGFHWKDAAASSMELQGLHGEGHGHAMGRVHPNGLTQI